MAKSVDTELDAELAAQVWLKRLTTLGTKEHLSEDDLKLARLAVATFSGFTRYKQTENARDALQFRMARDLSTDPDQLQRYVRATMPGSPIARALPEPVKEAPKS